MKVCNPCYFSVADIRFDPGLYGKKLSDYKAKTMKIRKIKIAIVVVGILLPGCSDIGTHDDYLFRKFQDPAADARPMVRWWWNGNCVEAGEINKELEVMKKAGIGGVEINSIAMPPEAKKTSARALQWGGKEWIEMVRVAGEKAKELGMITDLIVGSGWPFGGRFLKEDEIMQRIGVKKQSVAANTSIDIHLDEFLSFTSHHTPGTKNVKPTSDVEIISAKLIPVKVNSLYEILDITSEVKNNKLFYQTDGRDYVLVFVYKERNFKSVYHGSPGADGPIMDHYNSAAVRAYLDRLKAIEKETGLPLSALIRALFCDSIELGGSNWTSDMNEQFISLNGYDITPWLPFVIQTAGAPNRYETSEELAENIRRVQYDYYNTIIKVFLERFTREFQDFCSENNVLCRYQAYGTPFYMGLFQGNMIPDIPESNNWIYSRGRDEAETSAYTWNRNHGYMLWNKAASSGAHIMGRSITSCEAMTNTSGVFRTSLETVKQSDDINFITGINHTVLHGYSYSPPEAGFPGWVRYGAYFNEKNSWWKYFKYWTDYNARLSSVFQNSTPEIDIAVLGRVRDLWGEAGPARSYLNVAPWYYAQLWESFSNLGSSCDYIHQPVIEKATIEDTKLVCGKMKYSAVVLTELESLTPRAARKLLAFAEEGGKIVFVGKKPYRSLSFKDAEMNDATVFSAVESIMKTQNGFLVEAPEESADFISWTISMMEDIELSPQVAISHPSSHLYCMKQMRGEQEIYFFANSDRKNQITFRATFPTENKLPYIWIPETGERFAFPHEEKNQVQIKLEALESALIVFEPDRIELPVYTYNSEPGEPLNIETVWTAKFEHVNGTKFTREMKELIDFKLSDDEALQNFAGTVTYSTHIEKITGIKYIHLTEVNQAVTSLEINGITVGTKWYGNHIYDVSPYLQEGNNNVEIKLTTTLANYCRSLVDNPTAQRWTRGYKSPFSSGLAAVLFTR